MSSSSLVVDPVATTLEGYVGFDTITQQIEKKLLKRGFHFNVMVVGQSGLGKSTLVNTIFASHLIESKARLAADEPTRQTTEIETVSHLVEENGVHLRLNIVDTPGYGDQVNNENCWEPIIKYIKDQHSAYLRKELTATRERYIQDSRIHCCLFFISPTGHALKPIDIVVLKKLSEVVNVVPVIAKSDSLTIEERQAFKQRIKAELTFHNIKLYPYESDEDDEQEQALNESIRDLLPFAIVGSERNVVIDGKPVRGRKNRYGVINVENEEHCEFIYLRNFLTRTHLQDLIETTAQIHYEAFRAKQLLAIKESTHPSGSQSNLNNASQSTLQNRPNQWPAAAAATASNYHTGQQGPFGNASQSTMPSSPHSAASSPNPMMMSHVDSSQGMASPTMNQHPSSPHQSIASSNNNPMIGDNQGHTSQTNMPSSPHPASPNPA